MIHGCRGTTGTWPPPRLKLIFAVREVRPLWTPYIQRSTVLLFAVNGNLYCTGLNSVPQNSCECDPVLITLKWSVFLWRNLDRHRRNSIWRWRQRLECCKHSKLTAPNRSEEESAFYSGVSERKQRSMAPAPIEPAESWENKLVFESQICGAA